MNGAFVRDFQQPMTLLIRQLANQFNVAFNVVGEVPLPTPIKTEIGRGLLAPVVVERYNGAWLAREQWLMGP
jgi:hypothetical protein